MKKNIIISILILSFCMTLAACNSETKKEPDPITQGKKIVTAPEYMVYKQSDESNATVKRYVYRIVTDISSSDEQLLTLFGFLDKPEFGDVVMWIYKDKASYQKNEHSAVIERLGKNKPVLNRK